jgi:hypothetical protein
MKIKAYDKQGKLVMGFSFAERDSVTEREIRKWKANFLMSHPKGMFKEVANERSYRNY